MTRIFLAGMGLMFVAFGLWSLLSPLQMTGNLGVEIGGPNGTFEIRGVFGGVSLGAAILCLAGAIKDEMVPPALWFIVAYMGGYCFARIASIFLGDLPEAARQTSKAQGHGNPHRIKVLSALRTKHLVC